MLKVVWEFWNGNMIFNTALQLFKIKSIVLGNQLMWFNWVAGFGVHWSDSAGDSILIAYGSLKNILGSWFVSLALRATADGAETVVQRLSRLDVIGKGFCCESWLMSRSDFIRFGAKRLFTVPKGVMTLPKTIPGRNTKLLHKHYTFFKKKASRYLLFTCLWVVLWE